MNVPIGTFVFGNRDEVVDTLQLSKGRGSTDSSQLLKGMVRKFVETKNTKYSGPHLIN